MPGVASLTRRVARLEQGRAPISPIARAWGSFDAFAAQCQAEIAAGRLDSRDFPEVLTCLARWERDGTWTAWQRDAHVWQLGTIDR